MKPFNVFPYDSKFDFMRLRWFSAALSIVLLVVAVGAMTFKGFNFALDFTGGTVTELRFAKPADVDGVRKRLDAAGYPSAQVQTFGSGNDPLVRLEPRELALALERADSALRQVEAQLGLERNQQLAPPRLHSTAPRA
ncbi:MAG: hypothetical protein ACMG5Z_05840 [Luteimonas sp.]